MSTIVQVGNATIVALSDTEQPYAAREVYPDVAEGEWEQYRAFLTSDGQVLLNFGCYAIRVDGRTVLVDTGFGPGMQGKLLDELRDASIGLEEVDVVVFTHLHGDHIGWNVASEGGTARPRFPRARYLVPAADWQHYSSQPQPSAMFRDQVVPLGELGVMDLVGGDHAITPSVTTVATPGHTPGHLSVAVTSGGEHSFILGDVVISRLDAREPGWKNRFDWDTLMARATRESVLERLEREGALVGASYFPKPGLGRFVRSQGRWDWQPVPGAGS